MYDAWRGQLKWLGLELHAAELPGRRWSARVPLVADMNSLVGEIADELTHGPPLPTALLGHSLGAWVAWELARHLRRRSPGKVVCLVVACCPAPQLPPRLPPLSGLPDAEFLEAVGRRYGRLPIPPGASPDERAELLRALRKDMELAESFGYVEEHLLECPVLALGGADDPAVRVGELEAWRGQTQGAFATRLFPGGHFPAEGESSPILRAVLRYLPPLVETIDR